MLHANTTAARARHPAAPNWLERSEAQLCLREGWWCWALQSLQQPLCPKLTPPSWIGHVNLSAPLPSVNTRAGAHKHHKAQTRDATAGEGLVWLFPALQLRVMNCSGLTSSSWRKQDAPSPQCQRWKKTLPEGNLINCRAFLGFE